MLKVVVVVVVVVSSSSSSRVAVVFHLQSHVTPTQMVTTQTREDTPMIATRIITKICTHT